MLLFILLVACTPSVDSSPASAPAPTNTGIPPSPTFSPTQTAALPTPTPRPPTVTVTAVPSTATPRPACVTVIYEGYAQFEIIDPTGQRVLVDVFDPEKLSYPARATDILLTTHTHWDHYNPDFQAAFPGEQLFVQTGSLEYPDVKIQGLASAHNAGDRLKPEGGTNYIYLIEIGGLRIAHFGDIGQHALTDEQLGVLGQVDVALMQLNNSFSDMNVDNAKGIGLMNQLQPRLIIPTHLNLDTVKLAVVQWEGFFADSANLQICNADLRETGTEILLMGEAAETMQKYVELLAWGGR